MTSSSAHVKFVAGYLKYLTTQYLTITADNSQARKSFSKFIMAANVGKRKYNENLALIPSKKQRQNEMIVRNIQQSIVNTVSTNVCHLICLVK